MKKLLLLVVLICISLYSVMAVEWGGRISNDSSFSGNKFDSLKVKQTNTADLWLNIPLTKSNSSYFSTEGYYKFIYDTTETATNELTNTLDLNLFKFFFSSSLKKNNMISLSVGRYLISDLTSTVFSQVCDGIYIKYSGQLVDFNAYGGYTGLLNSKIVSILNAENTEYKEEENDFYSFAPKYLPVGVSIAFPSLFGNQRMDLQAWGFFDFNGDNNNRYYAMLGFDGYLSKNLSYKLDTVVGSKNLENLMNLSTLTVSIYPTKSIAINLTGNYASGKQGSLSSFNGFTSMTAYSTFAEDLQYSHMIKGGLTIIKAFGTYGYLSAGGSAIFDFPEDEIKYTGCQVKADALWNIFQDVQVSVSLSQFIADNEDNNKTNISLKAIIAF